MVQGTSLRCLLWIGLAGPLALCGWLGSRADSSTGKKVAMPAQLRRPVALVLADKGKWLFVANQRSGSISVLDTGSLRTVAEVGAGRQLADLVRTPDERHLLAVDEAADQLLLLARRGSGLEILDRVGVSPGPVSVQVAGDGSRCFVASLWSRRLTIVELASIAEAPTKLRVAKTLALPFAPRKQLLVHKDTKLIVADSFGGRLAVVDVGRGEVEEIRTLPAHNIRGLALNPAGDKLLVAHQVLNSLAQTTFDDVHWGNLMTNNLRSLALNRVLTSEVDLLQGSYLAQLGEAKNGAGDPAGIAIGAEGKVVVTLGGLGEISWGTERDDSRRRLSVGRRPTAVVTSPDGRRAYVANTFADSISVVDLQLGRVEAEVTLGPQRELSLEERGELLFYDARLAHDGWFSCHSCHTDGHTNGLLNDNLGDNSFGAPKRVLSLLGVRDTGPWAWNGSIGDLESQIRKSIETTLRGPKPSEAQVQALTAYLRTLSPPPSAARLTGEVDEKAVRRGREVFQQQACGNCHAPPEYTSPKTYNVGLTDEVGNKSFNPPSLRGVSQGGPFFHDNRARSLEEVFTRYQHQLKGELSKQELDDLLAFLRSL
jgi:YVTN family beta-propeller protein